jgi:hypothetical protein
MSIPRSGIHSTGAQVKEVKNVQDSKFDFGDKIANRDLHNTHNDSRLQARGGQGGDGHGGHGYGGDGYGGQAHGIRDLSRHFLYTTTTVTITGQDALRS